MAALVVLGLIAWVRRRLPARSARVLADLEARGVTRRSEKPPGGRMSARGHRNQAGAPARLLVLLPLAVFLGLAALFFLRLGAGDPSRIPSALIGRPAPRHQSRRRCRASTARRQADAGHRRGRFQGRGDAGQCLGLVVRAVPRRSAAAEALAPTSASASSASTTRTSPTMRAASSAATAIRSSRPAPTPTAAPRSNGASTACRRPSSSAATARIAYKLVGPITERT